MPRRARRALAVQRVVGHLVSPLSTFAVVALLRLVLGLRIAEMRASRRRFREILAEGDGPLLICANHLTLIDSALIAWALGSPAWYVFRFAALPWNVPDQANFAATPLQRLLVYLFKCVPMPRGGSREAVADTLARFSYVLSRGDVGLIFPEGGRSRSGRVEIENAAWGVGRIVKGLPGCRVVCVYLRGESQQSWSDYPARGDRLHVQVARIEPKSDHAGLRGSRDVARQIVSKLIEMEEAHFDDRQ